MSPNQFTEVYLKETIDLLNALDRNVIRTMAHILLRVKADKGRLFFVGVGGGAGTGSHAVNDFNKIAEISSFSLSDNVSLLTALANDEGWDTIFKRQLEMYHMTARDCLFIFSGSGGTVKKTTNLLPAIEYAKTVGAKVMGVVWNATSITAQKSDACIIVPCANSPRNYAHVEDIQMLINHLLANMLKENSVDLLLSDIEEREGVIIV